MIFPLKSIQLKPCSFQLKAYEFRGLLSVAELCLQKDQLATLLSLSESVIEIDIIRYDQ